MTIKLDTLAGPFVSVFADPLLARELARVGGDQ